MKNISVEGKGGEKRKKIKRRRMEGSRAKWRNWEWKIKISEKKLRKREKLKERNI